MLDCFFELEVAVGLWAKEVGHRDTAAPFGQRVQALAVDTGLSSRAKPGQLRCLQGLPESCKEIARIRNAVAHSRWQEGQIQGQPVALFETLSLVLAGEGAMVPISVTQIREAANEARQLANRLCGFLKQNRDAL